MKIIKSIISIVLIVMTVGCASPSINTRFAKDLQVIKSDIPPSVIIKAEMVRQFFNVKIVNNSDEVWRLDWSACAVSKDPDGWQSSLIPGNATLQTRNSIQPPMVISPGTVNFQMYVSELWVTYGWLDYPVPDGGGFILTLGMRDQNDKLHFHLLKGNISTLKN